MIKDSLIQFIIGRLGFFPKKCMCSQVIFGVAEICFIVLCVSNADITILIENLKKAGENENSYFTIHIGASTLTYNQGVQRRDLNSQFVCLVCETIFEVTRKQALFLAVELTNQKKRTSNLRLCQVISLHMYC